MQSGCWVTPQTRYRSLYNYNMQVTGPNWPSTRALAAALAAETPLDYILNWGVRSFNGWEQLCTFAEAGVQCPLATDSLEEAREYMRGGHGELWGRRFAHTQGSDIVGPKHPAWRGRDFWVQPIQAADEYRQHVWDGRCIRIGRKVQTGPTTRVLPVRSRKNGWTLDYAAQAPDGVRDRIRLAAKAAVAALGYAGGAADILVGTDGEVYVLEVNTAPSLRDLNTLQAYVRAISRWGKGLEH